MTHHPSRCGRGARRAARPGRAGRDRRTRSGRGRRTASRARGPRWSVVKIANLAQLVNVIAPIFTNPDGLFLQTIYHPLRLAAEHSQEVALDAHVECDTVEYADPEQPERREYRIADLGPFALLDVAATRDRSGQRVVVSVVNRSSETAVKATVSLGDAEPVGLVSRSVQGDSPRAKNSFDERAAVDVVESRFDASAGTFEYEFAPHSYTQLDIEIGAGR
ncbi:MAG: hypothetical protein GEV07_07230 [Streptosporangiales bacterium]|nr:hypothetical protein [Streptosporangiales bacterium]